MHQLESMRFAICQEAVPEMDAANHVVSDGQPLDIDLLSDMDAGDYTAAPSPDHDAESAPVPPFFPFFPYNVGPTILHVGCASSSPLREPFLTLAALDDFPQHTLDLPEIELIGSWNDLRGKEGSDSTG